jgi:hypothetical protein
MDKEVDEYLGLDTSSDSDNESYEKPKIQSEFVGNKDDLDDWLGLEIEAQLEESTSILGKRKHE